MGCKVCISNAGRSKRFSLLQNGADRLWAHTLLFNGYRGSFPGGGYTAGTRYSWRDQGQLYFVLGTFNTRYVEKLQVRLKLDKMQVLGTLHEDLGTLYIFYSSAVQKKSLLPSTVTFLIFYIFDNDICSSTIRKDS